MLRKYKKIKILILSMLCSSVFNININAMQQKNDYNTYSKTDYTQLSIQHEKIRENYNTLNKNEKKHKLTMQNIKKRSPEHIPTADDIANLMFIYSQVLDIIEDIEYHNLQDNNLTQKTYTVRGNIANDLVYLLNNLNQKVFLKLKKEIEEIFVKHEDDVWQEIFRKNHNTLFDLLQEAKDTKNLYSNISKIVYQYNTYFNSFKELKKIYDHILNKKSYTKKLIDTLSITAMKVIDVILNDKNNIDPKTNISNIKDAYGRIRRCSIEIDKISRYIISKNIQVNTRGKIEDNIRREMENIGANATVTAYNMTPESERATHFKEQIFYKAEQ